MQQCRRSSQRGNWRHELNMIKQSKVFDPGPGAVSCAYWKGPLFRDLLHTASFLGEFPQNHCAKEQKISAVTEEDAHHGYACLWPDPSKKRVMNAT